MAELTDEERAARRDGLGASDAAGIFGFGYRTPFGVWADKVWGAEVTVTPWMQRGHDLEPIIAAKYAAAADAGHFVPGMRTDHPEVEWLYATLDYRDINDGHPIETKAVDRFAAPDWGPSLDPDGVPDHYELQLRQQVEVTGSDYGIVAALFVETWELRWYRIEADPNVTALLLDGSEAFWLNHVVARVPPPITNPDKDWEALKSIPLDVERTVDLPTESADLVLEWRRARGERKAAAKVEKECKAELARLMDGAGTGRIDGEAAVTSSEHYRGKTLVRKLADRTDWRHE